MVSTTAWSCLPTLVPPIFAMTQGWCDDDEAAGVLEVDACIARAEQRVGASGWWGERSEAELLLSCFASRRS